MSLPIYGVRILEDVRYKGQWIHANEPTWTDNVLLDGNYSTFDINAAYRCYAEFSRLFRQTVYAVEE